MLVSVKSEFKIVFNILDTLDIKYLKSLMLGFFPLKEYKFIDNFLDFIKLLYTCVNDFDLNHFSLHCTNLYSHIKDLYKNTTNNDNNVLEENEDIIIKLMRKRNLKEPVNNLIASATIDYIFSKKRLKGLFV